jgi:hypothetical protein
VNLLQSEMTKTKSKDSERPCEAISNERLNSIKNTIVDFAQYFYTIATFAYHIPSDNQVKTAGSPGRITAQPEPVRAGRRHHHLPPCTIRQPDGRQTSTGKSSAEHGKAPRR